MLCERAVSRYTHGSFLAEKSNIQDWIAESKAEMTAARLMTLYAAWKMDQVGSSEARVEIAMIKYYGATVLYNVIDRAIQVHGALGFSTDMPLERMYRRARRSHLRRTRRGPQADGGAPGAQGLSTARRAERAHPHPSQGRPGQVRGTPRRGHRQPLTYLLPRQ